MHCTPQTPSSQPEHSLPLTEGNAKWRDPLSRADYHFCRIVLTVAVLMGLFLVGNAQGQSTGAPRLAKTGRFNCSPAPCVLPPTQASEGGNPVTDTPIVSNPPNPKQLLLGSVDGNCPPPSVLGFHLSTDGGSTWKRHCMPSIITRQHAYWPSLDPSVGYDRNGAAYIVGMYNSSDSSNGFIAFQKSADGTHWSKPAVALRHRFPSAPLETWFTVDTDAGSPRVNSLYVSGVMDLDQGSHVLVSHSADGGATWKQAAVDPLQKPPEEDDFTRMTVGRDGTVYVAWLHCRGKSGSGGALCPTVHLMFSRSKDGGNTWSTPQQIPTVGMPHYWLLPNTDQERVDNYPVIGVDNSNGAHAGNLYVAMYTWSGTYLRVQVIRSTDGGNDLVEARARSPRERYPRPILPLTLRE
jgi:hypothetical protein